MGFVAALMLLAWNAGYSADSRSSLADNLFSDINQATWIAEGKSTRVVYVFFDPNCPYCRKLFIHTRPWVKANKLQLRWVPVGILTTTSPGKAAAMLQAKNPLQALHRNENNFKHGGGLDEDLPSDEVAQKLKANADLLGRTPSGVVPLMLFRTREGSAVMVVGSPPKDKLTSIFKQVM